MTPPEKDDLYDRFIDSQATDWGQLASERPEHGAEIESLARIERIRAAFLIDSSAQETQAPMPAPAVSRDASLPWVPGYEVIEEIGEGGFARIYRARDQRTERLVALKLLRRRLGLRPDAVQRFLREGKALAKISHPGIVRVYHVIDDDERLGLSMELVRGETLRELLDHERWLPPNEVAAIGADLASALRAVHEAGYVHRDVKPENVMREPNGRVVLMDFGLSRSFTTDSRLTGTGILVGTPLAMAPEQYEFKEVDARTDIYALGALCYRLATGRCHVSGDSMQEIRDRVLAGDHPRLTELRADFPGDLAAIVEKAMEVDPRSRYSSAARFESALRGWLSRGDAEPASASRDAVASRDERGGAAYGKAVVVLLSVILALLLGILAFLVYLTMGPSD